MPAPPVIAFTPVPLRRRADGWTPELQLRFIQALAKGLAPGDAARSVGKNRQNAYALRKRPGAESFTAAWDAAVAHARAQRAPAPPPRPPIPGGAEAGAIAARGLAAVERASRISPAACRQAFGDMLDSLYRANSDNCDMRGGGRAHR